MFYVWFDAPIEYIGATKEWADADPANRDWRSWWFDAPDVRYVEFMAKDNVPFHTVSFPATILGSGEPWKLADYIKGFSWLNFYGGKFSTSQRRGIFLDQALKEYPADYWRYWLVANAPETDDASFTFSGFAAVCNKDLADTFGNFVNRCLRFCSARFGNAVPAGGEPGAMEAELAANVQAALDRYTAALAAMQLRRAAAELKELWTIGNVYVDRAAPWTAIKTDKDRAAVILRVGDQPGAALRDRRLADHPRHLRPAAPEPRCRDRRRLLADRRRRRTAGAPRRPPLRGAAAAVQEDRPRRSRRPLPTLRRRGGGRGGGLSPFCHSGTARRVGPGTHEHRPNRESFYRCSPNSKRRCAWVPGSPRCGAPE